MPRWLWSKWDPLNFPTAAVVVLQQRCEGGVGAIPIGQCFNVTRKQQLIGDVAIKSGS